MVIDQTKLVLAFWHRTWRAFVPLTPEEIGRKCGGAHPRAMGGTLAALRGSGMAEVRGYNDNSGCVTTWNLTPRGERMARNMMGQN